MGLAFALGASLPVVLRDKKVAKDSMGDDEVFQVSTCVGQGSSGRRFELLVLFSFNITTEISQVFLGPMSTQL